MINYKLKDLIKIHNGTKYSHLETGNIPLYGSGGIMSYVNDFLYDGEAVLLPRKGTLSNIMYTNGKIWTVDTMYYATTNEKVNPYYLYCYLSLLDLKHLDSGSALPSMTKSVYEDLEIKLPNIQTQKSIAKVLSDLDAKIELNNKINQELEAMAKTLYDYWFVQFDFPDKNGKPYKSSGGKMVYNEELKREIPEGWEVKKLSEISSFISRGISPKYIEEGGSCVINQKCVRQGTVLFEQTRRNNESLRDSSKKRVELYDVLVNSTGVGTLGRVSLVRRLPEEIVTVDSHVTIVRCDVNQISKFYFGYSLLQKQLELESFSLGSTGQVELSRNQLENVNLIIPPIDLQQKFDEIYNPVCEKLANNEIQNKDLTELRDWLLPMLMNGQVTDKEAGD